MFLAERGYAVLFQDTRGRFGSDGDFVPVEHEKEDGAATVRWVRSQPWCDGRIGVFGPSYLGFTTWAMIGACAVGAHVRPRTNAFADGRSLSCALAGALVQDRAAFAKTERRGQQFWAPTSIQTSTR